MGTFPQTCLAFYTFHVHSFYPLVARGAGDLRKLYVRGGAGIYLVNRGAGTLGGLPNLRRAGDFYEFCENVIQFFVEIE